MALQSVALPIVYPGIATLATNAPGLGTNLLLDAAGEYDSFVVCASEDMVISHVGFKCNAATGSPTADVRIETVDATTGVPTGTLWAANTNIVTATLTTAFALHALTASATITKSQIFAVKIVYNSGTSFTTTGVNNFTAGFCFPYEVNNTSGSAAKAGMNAVSLVLGSSTTTFYPIHGFLPTSSIAANAFNNTSSARRGVRFQVPFKCQVAGFRYYRGTSVGDFNAAIFDDAGAELSSSSTAFDGDQHVAAASSMVELYFDNAVTLSPATWYRLAIEPSSATNCNMYTATLPSLNYRSGWPGGTNWHYTTYVASSWTDTATDQVPLMDIVIKQFDDGVNVSSTTPAYVIGG